MPGDSSKSKYLLLAFTVGIALLVGILFAWLARWRGLPFSIDPRNLLSVLSPLLLTAGFIERAVEVIISPWRDAEATKLSRALAVSQAASEASLASGDAAGASVATANVKKVSEELADYKGKTQQYAFMASLTLSLAAASVGVRALWPLLDMTTKSGFEQASATQQGTFLLVDLI